MVASISSSMTTSSTITTTVARDISSSMPSPSRLLQSSWAHPVDRAQEYDVEYSRQASRSGQLQGHITVSLGPARRSKDHHHRFSSHEDPVRDVQGSPARDVHEDTRIQGLPDVRCTTSPFSSLHASYPLASVAPSRPAGTLVPTPLTTPIYDSRPISPASVSPFTTTPINQSPTHDSPTYQHSEYPDWYHKRPIHAVLGRYPNTRKVSHKKVCGFCNFVHILWQVTKLHRKLASDVTSHKILICVKSQGKYICGCHKILSLC